MKNVFLMVMKKDLKTGLKYTRGIKTKRQIKRIPIFIGRDIAMLEERVLNRNEW